MAKLPAGGDHIPGIVRDPGPRKLNTNIPHILPHERVFPIQIGSELFKLSGASISSDAPSYFSQFFESQVKDAEQDCDSIRTLYIDRDPETFRDISRHLQGYHISPSDGEHFVKLFADAQFYSLPRLISQLYEESIFTRIGSTPFSIPRDIFSSPGNSPNYFTTGFAMSFSTPTDIFPGLPRDGLLRPPSIKPPSVPNRSAEIFAEILHLLRGYPVNIRNEAHRQELLRDCRYYHFKGLEQKLIRHHIAYNPLRKRNEITLCIEDVRQSGISVVGDPSLSPPTTSASSASSHASPGGLSGWVNYARPFVDDKAYELVLQIGNEWTTIDLATMRADFHAEGRTKVTRLFEVIATKLNLPITQPLGLLMKNGGAGSRPASPGNTSISEDLVRISIPSEASVVVDGKMWTSPQWREQGEGMNGAGMNGGSPSKKRKRMDSDEEGERWIVKTGQWRLLVQNKTDGKPGVECVLVAVKIDAVSGEKGRNVQRGFLGE